MRVALLARVSSARQGTADRHSLPVQAAQMREFAERRGWDVVRVFEIPGESAFTDNLARRPQFAAAIRAAELGEFDALVVYDMSRFARDQFILHDSMRRLRACGVALFGINGVDYVSEPLRAGVEGAFAEQQSRDQAWKIREAKQQAFRRGLPVGSLPLGYVRGEDGVPVPLALEAEAIRWAFERRAGGAEYAVIIEEFERRGLRPRSRRGYVGFTPSGVKSLLENDFYCGYVRHGEERRRGVHEAIVSEGLWSRVQLVKRPQVWSPRAPSALLAGLVVCSACGRRVWLTGDYKESGKRRPVAYRESSHVRGALCPNMRTVWSSREPDRLVGSALSSMMLDRSWLARAAVAASRGPVAGVDVSRERSRLEAVRQRVTTAYVAGALAEGDWRRELQRVESALGRLPSGDEEAMEAVRLLGSFGEVWETASLEERREICGELLEAVVMDTRGKRVWLEPREEYGALFAHRAGGRDSPSVGAGPLFTTPLYSPDVLMGAA